MQYRFTYVYTSTITCSAITLGHSHVSLYTYTNTKQADNLTIPNRIMKLLQSTDKAATVNTCDISPGEE